MSFTGRALYNSGVWDGVAEDVSEEIGMISPLETPFLDSLPPALNSARSILHEWLDDALNPLTITTSSAVDSDTADTAIGIIGGNAPKLMQGTILLHETTLEMMKVSAHTTGNTITVNRAQAGTTATSLAAGQNLTVITNAALDGSDVTVDISGARTRRTNYCQAIKFDIIVAGSVEATTQLGGIGSEMTYQKEQRLREAVRFLERAVLRGKSLANSIGSATAERSMNGVIAQITTNVATGLTLSNSVLDNQVKKCWDNGVLPDLIVVGDTWKRIIDTFNGSRMRNSMVDGDNFLQRVDVYEGTYGKQAVMLNRHMRANAMLILRRDRVRVLPLTNRSFRYEPISKSGDSTKAMIIGDYTAELHNEEGAAYATA